ncbi:MAG TPA: N-acetylmuramoyl-L-alanine amidase [Candidatus Paceibacterota bacterium]|nr:N-acetylmuramoyl-L-alanine amidase [Candidatus Paceibacterota bacterium]
MKRFLFIAGSAALLLGVWYVVEGGYLLRYSDIEPGFGAPEESLLPSAEFGEEDESVFSLPAIEEPLLNGRIRWSVYWQEMTPEEERVYGAMRRPPGPPRVGIQAGHWRLDEVPEELEGLRASSGARGGGYTEQETVLEIARRVKTLLESEGIVVDLLPATIPVDYVADAFVSIHADGSSSANVSGFKISGPRRDFSGKAEALVAALYDSYSDATGLKEDSNITRRMSSYYAFNWRRYDHALHPMTPAAIVETRFMTSATDRAVIVIKPQIAAEGIAEGILTFLREDQ